MGLGQFRNIHTKDKIIILGCGASAVDIVDVDHSGVILFGVNDISRLISPKYLLVVDTPAKFLGLRNKAVVQSGADYLFTQIHDWKPMKPTKKVIFQLGNNRLKNIESMELVDYSNNSPYMAALIAYKMGCKNIGILGVDFTKNHFYAEDGDHVLIDRLNDIDIKYKELREKLNSKGVNLYNLSKHSALTHIPKMDMLKFLKK